MFVRASIRFFRYVKAGDEASYNHATACSALRPVSNGATMWRRCLRLLLGYHNYYAIHGSPYTSAHVLIENTHSTNGQ